MKIVLLSDSLGAGGAQRQLCGLAVMLNNLDYDVNVAYYHEDNFYKDYLDNNNVPSMLIPNASGVIKRVAAVRGFLKASQPDWVIAYQETPSLIASLCRMSGLKYKLLVSERNTTQSVSIKDRVRFFLYRWADSIVTNSYTQEHFLSKNYSWMRKKMTTITNFVDLENFSFSEKARGECPLITVVASIWPPKNTIGMIKALHILKQRDVMLHVKWFGYTKANQKYYDDALTLIHACQLDDYMELLPKTERIKDEYRHCDYFCLPSFYEGVPNVIAEAMASGRPIICSNVCDNSRYVIEGENGTLFDPNSPESIANAISAMLDVSDAEYSKMCVKSRELAEKLLSKETFINKYLELIQSC